MKFRKHFIKLDKHSHHAYDKIMSVEALYGLLFCPDFIALLIMGKKR